MFWKCFRQVASGTSCSEEEDEEGSASQELIIGPRDITTNISYFEEEQDEVNILGGFIMPTPSVDWLSLAEDPSSPNEDGTFMYDGFSAEEDREYHIWAWFVSSIPILASRPQPQQGENRDKVDLHRCTQGASEAHVDHACVKILHGSVSFLCLLARGRTSTSSTNY